MIKAPQPLSQPLPIPEPKDESYGAALRLHVDATDVLRRIFRVQETIPVRQAGVLTLMYPKWLPGYHSPQAPIELLAGLVFEANGERLHWVRHPTEVHAFHVHVPDGVDAIEASFQYVTPTSSVQGRVVVSQRLLNLAWNAVVLYPAGYFSRGIEVEASVTLPDGWSFATALPVETQEGSSVSFRRVGLDEFVDSPMMGGLHAKRIALDDTVTLNVFAEESEHLDASDEQIAAHRGVVEQADLLFGPRPFDRFEVLLALSDEIGSIGVEHHRSCEIASVPGYFADWENTFPRRDSFPHEYIHGWNGKHRRGADSWAPCFYQPIRNSLMWVYEGQTQYWDRVLSARSGLWSAEHALAALADTAATHDMQAGSRWRPMSDTTRDPIIAARSPLPWPSWQRSEDYYTEGALIWLDVDTRIRELSGDCRSLDDFARAFFGADEPRGGYTETYLFDDVVRTLNSIAEYDWSSFFIDMLENTRGEAPLAGIERGGYQLVYRDTPTALWRAREQLTGVTSFIFSLGLTVSGDGALGEVRWDSPAFEQALTSGSQLLGVNGQTFSVESLDRAVSRSREGERVQCLVQDGHRQREVEFDYTEGHRYPALQPLPDQPPRLDRILMPR
ncbi:M61 family metallopeptidase [Novosphingobium sp. 9U]|uniref:M61 family metallopeptidase n=1 Tax=Novosphingobium sp. 9U TaxID=2653158 RepID=UPI0012F0E7E3|nr:peptidase M61 [Novosphingobium sp. 9U]VWX47251.1 M61 glycyl aminopeptidase [Novosphingobium sp. 9U]